MILRAEDESGIETISLKFSTDEGKIWKDAHLTPSGEDYWKADLGIIVNRYVSLHATLEDTAGNVLEQQVIKGFYVRDAPKVNFPTSFLPGWNMFSAPLIAYPVGFEAQLSDYLRRGIVYHWEAAAHRYLWDIWPDVDWDTNMTPEPGRGYWIKVTDKTEVEFRGISVPDEAFFIPLAKAWNQIGHPFVFTVDWSAARVRKGDEVVTIEEAHARGWVRKFLYWWLPEEGQYDWAAAPDGSLNPGWGYWVRALVEGAELLVPPVPAPPRPPVGAVARIQPREEGAWRAKIGAVSGGLADTRNFFGVSPFASVDPGVEDVDKPPLGPSPVFLRAYFDVDGQRFLGDVRPPVPAWPGARVWNNLKVETGGFAGPVTLTWDISEIPERYAVLLRDIKADRYVNMRLASGYTYYAARDERRAFRIVVRPPAPYIPEIPVFIPPPPPVRDPDELPLDIPLVPPAPELW